MKDIRQELANIIRERCYLRGSFLLRSGKQSEEYFDKYLFESDPVLLKRIADAMADSIPEDAEVLAGLEMGGIPLAVMLGQLTGLPCAFVRKEAKPYGTCKLAEGAEIKHRKVVLVEDVITSGGQVILSANACREHGALVDTVLCVVDREDGGREALAQSGITLHSLFTRSELMSAAE